MSSNIQPASSNFGINYSYTTWRAWPNRPDLWQMNFQITRFIGQSDFGGANFAEVWNAVQRITPGDKESWHAEWLRMAQLVENFGKDCEQRGNNNIAKYYYMRASNYYHYAQFFLGDEPRRVEALHKVNECFVNASKYFQRPFEIVQIPFEKIMMEGYFLPAIGAQGARVQGKAPTILFLNGGDSLNGNNCFSLGFVAQECGFNFLVFEHPGVGLTCFEKRVPRIYDSERFVAPAVDFLLKRPEVDPSRIVLAGVSFAGYLVTRAAAFEKRLRAAIANPPVMKMSFSESDVPTDPKELKLQMTLFGAKTADELVSIRNKYDNSKVVDKISCPMFLLQSREDGLWGTVKISQALKCPYKIRIIEPEEGIGGAIHSMKDNLHVQNKAIFDWLIEIGVVDKT